MPREVRPVPFGESTIPSAGSGIQSGAALVLGSAGSSFGRTSDGYPVSLTSATYKGINPFPFQASAQAVLFSDYRSDVSQKKTILIRNTSTASRKLTVLPPKSAMFRVHLIQTQTPFQSTTTFKAAKQAFGNTTSHTPRSPSASREDTSSESLTSTATLGNSSSTEVLASGKTVTVASGMAVKLSIRFNEDAASKSSDLGDDPRHLGQSLRIDIGNGPESPSSSSSSTVAVLNSAPVGPLTDEITLLATDFAPPSLALVSASMASTSSNTSASSSVWRQSIKVSALPAASDIQFTSDKAGTPLSQGDGTIDRPFCIDLGTLAQTKSHITHQLSLINRGSKAGRWQLVAVGISNGDSDPTSNTSGGATAVTSSSVLSGIALYPSTGILAPSPRHGNANDSNNGSNTSLALTNGVSIGSIVHVDANQYVSELPSSNRAIVTLTINPQILGFGLQSSAAHSTASANARTSRDDTDLTAALAGSRKILLRLLQTDDDNELNEATQSPSLLEANNIPAKPRPTPLPTSTRAHTASTISPTTSNHSGPHVTDSYLTVSFNPVSHNLRLIPFSPESRSLASSFTTLPIPPTFVGSRRVIKMFLVNDSSVASTFTLTVDPNHLNSSSSTSSSPLNNSLGSSTPMNADGTTNSSHTPITPPIAVMPSEGRILPFSRQVVEVIYIPSAPDSPWYNSSSSLSSSTSHSVSASHNTIAGTPGYRDRPPSLPLVIPRVSHPSSTSVSSYSASTSSSSVTSESSETHAVDEEALRAASDIVQSEVTGTLSLVTLETGHRQTVSIKASSMLPVLAVSPPLLCFGHCPVGERLDTTVILTNPILHTPISFAFGHASNIDVIPRHGTIEPLKSLSIRVAYVPKSLGNHAVELPLTIADKRTVFIPISGNSSSIPFSTTTVSVTPRDIAESSSSSSSSSSLASTSLSAARVPAGLGSLPSDFVPPLRPLDHGRFVQVPKPPAISKDPPTVIVGEDGKVIADSTAPAVAAVRSGKIAAAASSGIKALDSNEDIDNEEIQRESQLRRLQGLGDEAPASTVWLGGQAPPSPSRHPRKSIWDNTEELAKTFGTSTSTLDSARGHGLTGRTTVGKVGAASARLITGGTSNQFVSPSGETYSFQNLEEALDHRQHRKFYSDYLKTSRLLKTDKGSLRKRMMKKNKERAGEGGDDVTGSDKDDDDDDNFPPPGDYSDEEDLSPERNPKNLGMSFARGLKDPGVELPRKVDKLAATYDVTKLLDGTISQVLRAANTANLVAKERERDDYAAALSSSTSMNEMATRQKQKGRDTLPKQKTWPTTPAERKDVETPLTHEDLARIQRAPTTTLDFGYQCVGSVGTRDLTFHNPLSSHILIELGIGDSNKLASESTTNGSTSNSPRLLSSGSLSHSASGVGLGLSQPPSNTNSTSNLYSSTSSQIISRQGGDKTMRRTSTAALRSSTWSHTQPELKFSYPGSVLIPPGHTGTFKICLALETPGKYQAPLRYCINGKHTASIDVTGDIVPMSLQVCKPTSQGYNMPSQQRQSGLSLTNESNTITSQNSINTDKLVLFKGPGADLHSLLINTPTSSASILSSSAQVVDSSLSFSFPPNSTAMSLSERLSLLNPHTQPIRYWFTSHSSVISVSPTQGIVEPGSCIDVMVTYAPLNAHRPLADELVLNVERGPPTTIICHSSLEAAKVEVIVASRPPGNRFISTQEANRLSNINKSGLLDFGLVPAGLPTTRRISIKNRSNKSTVFSIDSASLPSSVVVSPASALLPGHASVSVDITITPPAVVDNVNSTDTTTSMKPDVSSPPYSVVNSTNNVDSTNHVVSTSDQNHPSVSNRSGNKQKTYHKAQPKDEYQGPSSVSRVHEYVIPRAFADSVDDDHNQGRTHNDDDEEAACDGDVERDDGDHGSDARSHCGSIAEGEEEDTFDIDIMSTRYASTKMINDTTNNSGNQSSSSAHNNGDDRKDVTPSAVGNYTSTSSVPSEPTHPFRASVSFTIRGQPQGTRPYCVNISALTVKPSISVVEKELDFGAVGVGGAPPSLPFTLKNNSSTPMLLALAMTDDAFTSFDFIPQSTSLTTLNEVNQLLLAATTPLSQASADDDSDNKKSSSSSVSTTSSGSSTNNTTSNISNNKACLVVPVTYEMLPARLASVIKPPSTSITAATAPAFNFGSTSGSSTKTSSSPSTTPAAHRTNLSSTTNRRGRGSLVDMASPRRRLSTSSPQTRIWLIYVPPKRTCIPGKLTFNPSKDGLECSMTLPLYLPSLSSFPAIEPKIKAITVPPRIVLKPSILDFNSLIIIKADSHKAEGYTHRFSLTNNHSTPLLWAIQLPESCQPLSRPSSARSYTTLPCLNQSSSPTSSTSKPDEDNDSFMLASEPLAAAAVAATASPSRLLFTPSGGVLPAGQVIDVLVHFAPTQVGPFNLNVNVYAVELSVYKQLYPHADLNRLTGDSILAFINPPTSSPSNTASSSSSSSSSSKQDATISTDRSRPRHSIFQRQGYASGSSSTSTPTSPSGFIPQNPPPSPNSLHSSSSSKSLILRPRTPSGNSTPTPPSPRPSSSPSISSPTPYAVLRLQGHALRPWLRISTHELTLPCVPLGIPSCSYFTVTAQGYKTFELSPVLPRDIRVPINVTFPAGRTLNSDYPTVPVVVSFVSPTPASFSTKLEFLDPEGVPFGLLIHGSSDNSVLSLSSFMARHPKNFTLQPSPGKPLSLTPVSPEALAALTLHPDQFSQAHTAFTQGEHLFASPHSQEFSLSMASLAAFFDAMGLIPLSFYGINMERPSTESSTSSSALVPSSTSNHTSVGSMSTMGKARERAMAFSLQQVLSSLPVQPIAIRDVFAADGAKALKELLRSLTKRNPCELLQAKPGSSTTGNGGIGGASVSTVGGLLHHHGIDDTSKIYDELEAMLSFMKSIGCVLPHVDAKDLMTSEMLTKFLRSAANRQRLGLEALYYWVDLDSAAIVKPRGAEPRRSGSGSGGDVVSMMRKRTIERTQLLTAPSTSTLSNMVKMIEAQHELRSQRAWVTVLQQVVKAVVLRPITSSALKALPGLSSSVAITEAGLDSPEESNIYSQAERSLLAWLTHNARKADPYSPNVTVTNFSTDLNTSIVLGAVLAAHAPWAINLRTLARPRSEEPLDYYLRLSNAQKLLNALGSIGLDYHIPPDLIAQPSHADLVLFVSYLFNTLPSLIPASSVTFQGHLGVEVKRDISLRNPSPNPVTYRVRVDGAGYTCRNKTVTLPPYAQAFPLSVSFLARFARPAEGRLMLVPIRTTLNPIATQDPSSSFSSSSTSSLSPYAPSPTSIVGTGVGAPIVFNLRTSTVDALPTLTTQVSSKCYEQSTITVNINNPFPNDCVFTCSVIIDSQPDRVIPNPSAPLVPPGAHPSPFILPRDRVRVSKGQSFPLQISFLPWRVGPHTATIWISDPNVGELLVRINGKASLPNPLQRVQWTASARALEVREVPVPARSIQLEQARSVYYQLTGGRLDSTFIRQIGNGTSGGNSSNTGSARSSSPLILTPDHLPRTSSFIVVPPQGASSFPPLSTVATSPPIVSTSPKKGPQPSFASTATPTSTSAPTAFSMPGSCEVSVQSTLTLSLDAPQDGKRIAPPTTSALLPSTTTTSSTSPTRQSEIVVSCTKLFPSSAMGMRSSSSTSSLSSSTTSSSTSAAPLSRSDLEYIASLFNDKASANRLRFAFKPNSSGAYKAQVLITNGIEVRCLSLSCLVSSQDQVPTLSFRPPLHQSTTQVIPLHNNTGESVTWRALVHGKGFTGPQEVIIEGSRSGGNSGGAGNNGYPLTFYATKVDSVKGKLELMNSKTGEHLSFELEGSADDPTPLDHLIFNCRARSSSRHSVTLSLPRIVQPGANRQSSASSSSSSSVQGNMMYKIQTDLSFISGTEKVFSENGKIRLQLILRPPLAGVFRGSVTLIPLSSPKEYLWATVEARVAPPEAEGVIDVATTVRGAATVDVPVKNPLDSPVDLDVYLRGPHVTGPTFLSLPASGTGVYSFTFSPLASPSSTPTSSSPLSPASSSSSNTVFSADGSLTFAHPLIGEFWYGLKLTAKPPAPVQLPTFDENSLTQYATVTNPTNDTLTLHPHSSSPKTFVVPPQVSVPPRSSATLLITYVPSADGSPQSARITLSDSVAGTWTFLCNGAGAIPKQMPEVAFISISGSKAMVNLMIRNPINENLKLNCSVSTNAPSSGSFAFFSSPESLSLTSTSSLTETSSSHRLQNQLRLQSSSSSSTSSTSSTSATDVSEVTTLSLAANGTLSIPLIFTPNSNGQTGAPSHGKLTICAYPVTSSISSSSTSTDALLRWVYPLKAVAESLAQRSAELKVVEAACRSVYDRVIELPCPGVAPTTTLTCEATFPLTEAHANAALSSLNFTVLSRPQSNASNQGPASRFVRVVYTPLRIMCCAGSITLSSPDGNKWQFPLRVISTAPPFDDTIKLTASTGSASAVVFELSPSTSDKEKSSNQDKDGTIPYEACIMPHVGTANSAVEFGVEPRKGKLHPAGSSDSKTDEKVEHSDNGMNKLGKNEILVTYAPKTYSQKKVAELLVSTPSFTWRYKLIGQPPKTKPTHSASKSATNATH